MSAESQTPHPVPPKPAPPDTNIWGLFGLLLGLIGFFLWIAAPVGLVMSYLGLKHPNNGLAIAGLIVSIISTIWAAIILGFLLLYFGMWAAMCGSCICLGMSAATDTLALENEVRTQVAEELELHSFEVVTHDFATEPVTGDDRWFSGTAVYDEESPQPKAIDFSGDAQKVNGTWQIISLQFQGEPYDWVEPVAFDEDLEAAFEELD